MFVVSLSCMMGTYINSLHGMHVNKNCTQYDSCVPYIVNFSPNWLHEDLQLVAVEGLTVNFVHGAGEVGTDSKDLPAYTYTYICVVPLMIVGV